MPLPDPLGPSRPKTRQQLEAELLAELKRAETAFHEASPDAKEGAAERYRAALQRFNDVVVARKIPPGWETEL